MLGALLPCPLEPTVGRPSTSSELRGFAPASERMSVGSAEHSPIKLVDDFVQFDISLCDPREHFSPLQVSCAVSLAPLLLQFYAY